MRFSASTDLILMMEYARRSFGSAIVRWHLTPGQMTPEYLLQNPIRLQVQDDNRAKDGRD
jgi:hypothetical protein